MGEKLPAGERPVVKTHGKVPDNIKEGITKAVSDQFRHGEVVYYSDEIIKEAQEKELSKEPYEENVVVIVNEITNLLLDRYGLDSFDIPVKNIHILPDDVYKKIIGKLCTAYHDPARQIILIREGAIRDEKYIAIAILLHEIIHSKGFLSFNAQEVKNPDGSLRIKPSFRRIGLASGEEYQENDQDLYRQNFIGLNEAVVSELENRYLYEVAAQSNNPEILEELQWQSSEEATRAKQEYIDKFHTDFGPEEILWIKKSGKLELRGYRQQRKVLKFIAESIATDTRRNLDEIYDEFFKAHFHGNILTIARLIEGSFGKKSFRAVGIMGDDLETAKQTHGYLTKLREAVLKTRENK